MYIYTYVYEYVCIHACIFIRLSICLSIYPSNPIQSNPIQSIHLSTYLIYLSMYIYVYLCVHVCARVHINTCHLLTLLYLFVMIYPLLCLCNLEFKIAIWHSQTVLFIFCGPMFECQGCWASNVSQVHCQCPTPKPQPTRGQKSIAPFFDTAKCLFWQGENKPQRARGWDCQTMSNLIFNSQSKVQPSAIT